MSIGCCILCVFCHCALILQGVVCLGELVWWGCQTFHMKRRNAFLTFYFVLHGWVTLAWYCCLSPSREKSLNLEKEGEGTMFSLIKGTGLQGGCAVGCGQVRPDGCRCCCLTGLGSQFSREWSHQGDHIWRWWVFVRTLLFCPSFQDSEYLVGIITLNYVVRSHKKSSFQKSLQNRNDHGLLTVFCFFFFLACIVLEIRVTCQYVKVRYLKEIYIFFSLGKLDKCAALAP